MKKNMMVILGMFCVVTFTQAAGFNGASYYLSSNSICIEAGTPLVSVTKDLDGKPRSMEGNGDGIYAGDIGCYEYIYPNARRTGLNDFNGDNRSDLAVLDQSTGRWFIRTLSGAQIAWDINWGWPEVQPIGR